MPFSSSSNTFWALYWASFLLLFKSLSENSASEWEIKNCSLSHLVKLSSCTYSANDEGLKKKIDSFLEYNGQQGKWYFQPDQRCPVVDSIIEENPLIAKDTLSYSTWLKMWSSSKN